MTAATQCAIIRFQSTSSARRTTLIWGQLNKAYIISIHVLREEDDPKFFTRTSLQQRFQSTSSARRTTVSITTNEPSKNISIHVLREEDDGSRVLYDKENPNFNPRPPRGGRLFVLSCTIHQRRNFNPRPPRGGRPSSCWESSCTSAISIHVLREEDDLRQSMAYVEEV